MPPASLAPIKATPLARRIAATEGVDLRSIAGTGPEGTITREDVEQAVRDQGSGVRGRESASTPVSQPVQLPATSFQQPASSFQPHSALRRTIAERMSQSAFTAPHVTLMTEAEATNLVSARAQLNQEVPAADKISYNTLLAALTARALREHPNVNARWEADGIRLLAEINIALAVDTERGLMTPVLREVDKLSLSAVQRGYGDCLTVRWPASRCPTTSQAAPSPSPTWAGWTWTASPRSSIHRRPRSWAWAASSRSRWRGTAQWSSGR